MGNLIIKGKGGAGNKLILQDQAGGAVLTTADSGATLGNSTQDNITRLGTVTTGNLSNNAIVYPTGHIVQIVQAVVRQNFSSSSSSYVATPLQGAITPSSASNKVLVMMNSVIDTSAAGRTVTLMIYRNSTAVSSASEGLMQAMDRGGGTRFPYSIHWLDSPNSTSAITYRLYAKAPSTFECPPYSAMDATITMLEIKG